VDGGNECWAFLQTAACPIKDLQKTPTLMMATAMFAETVDNY
jgi:hypothetical protein